MPYKQILVLLTFWTLFGWAGLSSAEPRTHGANAHRLSHSERMRMRGDLERFSQAQPYREKIEMRRQRLRERARQRFHDADRDGNGLLNRQEITRLNPNAAHHFDEIDRDRDGELSEQEVAQTMRRRMWRHDPHSLSSVPD